MKNRSGRAIRYPLLVYRRLYDMWFWPSMLAMMGSVAVVVLKPWFLSEAYVWFLPVAVISAGLTMYAWLARHSAFVQAHPSALRIKSPLFRLAVSYGRIHLVRTTPFRVQYPPQSLPWTRRQLAEKLYGHTCLVVEVRGLPLPRRVLAAVMYYFLLAPRSDGFILLVEDWLPLSHELEAARSAWVSQRLVRQEKRVVEQILES